MSADLGNKIATALAERKMTQRELAERLNVTEGVISRYISGDREPKPEMIANIATALSTTSDYLLGTEEKMMNHDSLCRIIARNASKLTPEEKMKLMQILLKEE